MLCEMIGGYNPFTSTNIQTTFENIIKLNINWPKNISIQCKKLLERIFVQDPNLRISLFEIKRDPFFRDFNWTDLDLNLSNEQYDNLLQQLQDIQVITQKAPPKQKLFGSPSKVKELNSETENINEALDTQLDMTELSPTQLFEPKSAGIVNKQHI